MSLNLVLFPTFYHGSDSSSCAFYSPLLACYQAQFPTLKRWNENESARFFSSYFFFPLLFPCSVKQCPVHYQAETEKARSNEKRGIKIRDVSYCLFPRRKIIRAMHSYWVCAQDIIILKYFFLLHKLQNLRLSYHNCFSVVHWHRIREILWKPC